MRFGLILAVMLPLLLVLGGSTFALRSMQPSHQVSTRTPVASLLPLDQYVDPTIGTLADGNVFPGATLPHGMVQWSPDTSAGGLSRPGGYNHGDLIIRGFSLTHLSGAGCVAFGDIPFMPTVQQITGPPLDNGSPYSARFDHTREVASPGYYGVRLGSGISVRLSTTLRTGFGSITYPSSSRATMLVNTGGSSSATSNHAGSLDATVHVHRNEISGFATGGHFCNLSNVYTVYFAARFSRPFASLGTWDAMGVHPGRPDSRGPRSGAYVTFALDSSRTVQVKVGLSYVSVADARSNLDTENPGWSFEAVRATAATVWNRLLNRIAVTGGDPTQKRIFYTALYHALLQPTVFSDANGAYRGFDGKVHIARGWTQYANFSGWDIYRTEIQLLAWLMPRETSDMIQSLVADAEEGGWLSKWPVANDNTGEMNGDPADPIIAEAYAFGARHFDVRTAFRFMVKGATQPGRGPKSYEERPGLSLYQKYGYLPPQTGGWGSAATTLEFAVADFAIARMARSLGERKKARLFMHRAQSWKHLFNPKTGFIEPAASNGLFPVPFNHLGMNGFVEGNAYQYTWMVPQNLAGLFQRMGGNGVVNARLDRFFQQLNAGPTSPYYYAGNEPGLEVPWEYDFTGRPWRTQAVVRHIITQLYTAGPSGLPGNDDLGTLSSWYVWAALGLYPEIPGVDGFVLGSPLFPQITIHWGENRVLRISAPGAAGRPYVAALLLDGRAWSSTWLPLSALSRAAILHYALSSSPNRHWGAAPADAPPSFDAP